MKPTRWDRYIGSMFFGSGNTTHVANASENIVWVNIVADYKEAENQLELLKSIKAYQDTISAQLTYTSKEIAKQGVPQEEQVKGYSKVMPGTHLEFQPGNYNDIYITVYYHKVKGDGLEIKEIVCQAHKLPSDTSIIVTNDMAIQLAKYGSIWIDTSGKNHRPS